MSDDASLPVDPDVDVEDARRGAPPRAVHLRLPYIGLVFAGGAVGTGVRELLSLVIPAVAGVPLGILVINVTGAFALGVLLEALLRRGADEGRRRNLRLLLGTGFLGGYTTYSTLAVGVAQVTTGNGGSAGIVLGILYGLVSVVLGAGAAAAGIALAAKVRAR